MLSTPLLLPPPPPSPSSLLHKRKLRLRRISLIHSCSHKIRSLHLHRERQGPSQGEAEGKRRRNGGLQELQLGTAETLHRRNQSTPCGPLHSQSGPAFFFWHHPSHPPPRSFNPSSSFSVAASGTAQQITRGLRSRLCSPHREWDKVAAKRGSMAASPVGDPRPR